MVGGCRRVHETVGVAGEAVAGSVSRTSVCSSSSSSQAPLVHSGWWQGLGPVHCAAPICGETPGSVSARSLNQSQKMYGESVHSLEERTTTSSGWWGWLLWEQQGLSWLELQVTNMLTRQAWTSVFPLLMVGTQLRHNKCYLDKTRLFYGLC